MNKEKIFSGKYPVDYSFPALDAYYSDTVLPLFLGLCFARSVLCPHQTNKTHELYEDPQKIYQTGNKLYQALRDKEHHKHREGRGERLVRVEIVFPMLFSVLGPNN
jgi:hypothetical protein